MGKPAPKQFVPEINSQRIKYGNQWLWISAVAIISFGLAAFNNYALDDFIVIVKNRYTQQGLAGIWQILSKDSFAGMTDANVAGLAGVRYRPLSLVTFAIEQQFFKGNPSISHFINVILFAFTGTLLYKLLLLFKTSFPENKWMEIAFITSLLFITLPIHSESIINIKGRDDLLCLLFFLLGGIQLFQYVNSEKNSNLFLASFFYFLSLMSKETGITFLAAYPLMLTLFSAATRKKIFSAIGILGFVACIFLLNRYLATNTNSGTIASDLLNNPFIHATFIQRYATVFLTWLIYFKLIIFPLHLSYDYNFNQVPLTDFADSLVIFSIALHASLIIFAIIYFRKKPVYAFSILFYFITFSIVSNFFINTGTPIAERFVLIPSIGCCLAFSTYFINGFEKIKSSSAFSQLFKFRIIPILIIILLFSIRNISRCNDWKNNDTLFLADANETPNSTKVQLNAGIACLNISQEKSGKEKKEWLDKSMTFFQKGIDIYPSKLDGYINMGVAYSWKNDFENARLWWEKARQINPVSPDLERPFKALANYYFREGMQYGTEKKYELSINKMRLALQYDSLNADILINLGGAYYTIENADSAMLFFQKSLLLNPENKNANAGLQAAIKMKAEQSVH